MPGGKPTQSPGPQDGGRRALDFAHRLLAEPARAASLESLLAELAGAFGAAGAGLAVLPDGTVVARHRPEKPAGLPWQQQPDLLAPLRTTPAAVPLRPAEGGSLLATALGQGPGGGWLLWLEEAGPRDWSPAEGAALALAGQALVRCAAAGQDAPAWARSLERQRRQQQLDESALVVRRLAHDFGNVLTGILGFAELALGQLEADAPVRQHVTEILQAARQGAHWTQQLRLFSRRGPSRSGVVSVAAVLADEQARLRPRHPAARLCLDVPADLPAVALDAEALRQLLAVLLDNACEALAGAGTVTVAARAVRLAEAEAADLYGSPAPGPAVEVAVRDTGTGLGPEVRQRLFAEPFFAAKPRHRGLGLAVAYGIVRACKGGLRLDPHPEGGTVARAVLPCAGAAAAPPGPAATRAPGERVLVVDDDPLILQLVCTTLARAGYRVRPAASAAEALAAYGAAGAEPFRLVLSDVLMPEMTGMELARTLLRQDAQVNVLFMSGQVAEDFGRPDLAPGHFDLLPKPFRPDGLLRAVRSALDRGPRRVPAACGP